MKFAEGNIFDRLCLLAGIGLAVATAAGFLGRFCWVCDLFSHFRVQIFQVALVFIGIAIWKKNNRQLAGFILLACLNYAVVLPFYFGKPSAAAVQPARAMLMNILASNGNTQQVLAAVREADPDILLLEEVTPKWEKALAGLNYPYRLSAVRTDCFGIMLLSKYPLANTNVVYLTGKDRLPGGPPFDNAPGRRTDPQSVPTLVADVYLPTGEISLIGTHPLPPFNAEYSARRNAQLAALPELIARQSKPVLLIGDLNTSPWSSHFRRLLKESGLKNSMQGFGVQPSWPADYRFLRIPIDQMLHSPAIRVLRRAIGRNVGSDHLPVIVDFSVL